MTQFQPKPAVLTAEEFAEVGEFLYGPKWQTPLAERLSVNLRTVQYMAAGQRPVHWGIADDLFDLVQDKAETGQAMTAKLKATLTAAAERD